jgi:hypothetical protein
MMRRESGETKQNNSNTNVRLGGYGLSFGDTSSGMNANSLNNGAYSHQGKTNYDQKYQIHNIEEDADEVIETTEGKEQMTEGKRP